MRLSLSSVRHADFSSISADFSKQALTGQGKMLEVDVSGLFLRALAGAALSEQSDACDVESRSDGRRAVVGLEGRCRL